MPTNPQPASNADALNAVITALGALVFATVRALPPDRQAGFAADLARLAQHEAQQGHQPTHLLLTDLQQAASAAAGV